MSETEPPATSAIGAEEKSSRRKIPGNLPYTTAPGVLKRALEKIPTAEKPAVFSIDFLGTVLGLTGGSARPVIPTLKAAGLLGKDGAPTDLYASFQTDGGRSSAALEALRNAFAEIFRRNQFAAQATDSDLVDIVVAITGLPKADPIARAIVGTFQAFRGFIQPGTSRRNPQASSTQHPATESTPEEDARPEVEHSSATRRSRPVNLAYNINIILPETTNMEVYNAIFKSLKGNLLN